MCGDGYEGRPDMYVARMSEDVGVKGVRMWVEYGWTTNESIWGCSKFRPGGTQKNVLYTCFTETLHELGRISFLL